MKTISVIVPVYNVEKYLEECLDSIIHQTYQKLQIVLVDDGSTDSSGIICDEYAKKDSRITVLHQTNQGAGAAKNAGLELIKGDYFTFLDSDDYIELNMYEVLIEKMNNYDVDIVQCLFTNEGVNQSLFNNYVFQRKGIRKLSPKKYLYEILYDWKYALLWNKLYKSNLLGTIRFPRGRKIDDEFFTYKLIGRASSILCIDSSLYHYRMRKTGVMNESSKRRLVSERVESFEERYHYISETYTSLASDYYKHLSEYIDYELKQTEDLALIEFLKIKQKDYPLKTLTLEQRIRLKLQHIGNKASNNRDNINRMEFFD